MQDEHALYVQERIRYLQSQINSHFLYTTLESMRGMCAAHQEQALRSAITQLAAMYRYSVLPELTVPLEEEIRVARIYDELLRRVKPHEIALVFQIPQELMQQPVPRMLIQPLVENALLHGFLNRGIDEGTIRIRARRKEDRFLLTIENDGIGIDAEKIVELNEQSGKNRQQIGFANVRERIRLLYPDRGSIEICSDGIRGAAVHIEIC